MTLKIRHKLFLALLLCTASTLIAMVLLMQWSLSRGFLDYINQVESEKLDNLIPRLIEIYNTHQGWAWLRGRDRVWRRLVADNNPRELRRRAPAAHFEGKRRPPRPPDPLRIAPRITLFSADRQPIFGRGRWNSGAREIVIDGETVGWLGLRKLRQVSALRDVNFLKQQSRSIALIAVAVLILAALLAFLLARHLVQPLQQVTATVRGLAGGDFTRRIDRRGRDEIADLTRDVDQLARTLDDNQRARQRWMADISHELRTPLAVVRGELEALEDGIRPFDQAALQSLQSEIKRLTTLVSDLHQLALADQGALSYRMEALDLREILQDRIASFSTRIHNHQLALSIEPEVLPSLPIQGDHERLLQLWTNLLENSVRYTDSGGEIHLQIRKTDKTIIVTLSDSAPSVDTDACERLFDRLYRLESSRSRAHGGSGLGLAICKSIVEAHAGTIVAQPSDLGGLSVVVELPLDARS